MKNKDSKSLLETAKIVNQILPSPFKWRLIKVMLSLMLNSVLELVGLAALIPIFSMVLKDNFVQENKYFFLIYNTLSFHNEKQFIIFLCVCILVFIILKNTINLFIVRNQAKFSFSLYRYFSSALQKYNYAQGYLHFKSENSNYIVRDIHVLPFYFSQNLLLPSLLVINEIIIVVLIILSISFYSFSTIILLCLTVFPISFVFYNAVRKQIQTLGGEKNKLNVELTKNLYQSIHGYVDVKINNSEQQCFSTYQEMTKQMTEMQVRSYTYVNMPTKIIEIGMVMGIVGIVIYGVYFWENKEQIMVVLSLFALAAYRIMPSINRIMTALISIREYQYVIDTVAKIKPQDAWEGYYNNSDDKERRLVFEKEIKIDKISFHYKDNVPILDNLSFNIAKGESIGFIGRSGSGKTTLINILLRFLYEKRGKILVDGVALDDSNINAWRHLIGYVQQEVYIVDASLAENIAFGIPKDEIDLNKLTRVIQLSSLEEVVKQLPHGFETRLGERGAQLSGGQRQRVGIARALYFDASILFFDEATSALDNETEEEITEAIRKLSENHLTMIIIAHRYSTLRYCNRIIELEKGEIKGVYQYDEVIKRVLNTKESI